MTLMALLFCEDPVLLQQRRTWLEQHFRRHANVTVDVRCFKDGVLLSGCAQPNPQLDEVEIAGDRIGRLGWSLEPLASVHQGAQSYFGSLHTHMPAMSAIWWWKARGCTLELAADPVGARPLFYFQDKTCIMLGSALQLFEACPWIDLAIDEAALHQRVALGYCLNGATPYRAVRRLQGGCQVELTLGKPDNAKYRRWHRWDAVATDHRPLDAQLDEIHQCFTSAIARQDDGVSMPIAALSGGLDTRVVIAGLLAAKRAPTCVTFTWRNSLDGALAQQFAAYAGLQQHIFDVPRPLDEPFLIKSAKALAESQSQIHTSYSQRLWTGYGGSIGAGYVHSNAAPVALARAGETLGAARMLLQGKGVAVAAFLFGRATAQRLSAQLEDQVVSALEANKPDDLGRRLQLYLLENQEPEQLRPLTENADQLGFDVAAPFYDPALLEKWLAVPLEQAIYHRAYVQWMQRLPAAVTAVPWQAYPGHERSPLPLPAEADQWSDTDAAYGRQLSANDLAFVDKCNRFGVSDSAFVAPWRRLAVRGAVGIGLQYYSYLCRTSAVYAAFEQGKGATLLDGI
jgi:asparagine synthase (glutamine-hydrolysing)